MRKLFLTLACLMVMSTAAFAADLLYTPQSNFLTMAPGTSQTLPMKVSIVNPLSSTFSLWYLDSVTGGNLPASWVTSSKSMSFISKWWPSQDTLLTITVPAGTAAGTYSGYVFSKAMKAHNYANAGTGMFLSITVPSRCSGVPSILIDSLSPSYIWPPNHSMERVRVEGKVLLPLGCTLYELGYGIEDEYGIYSGTGSFTISQDGAFSLAIPVEASRLGQDKDGRHYVITLYAEDDLGIGISDPLEVLVPHDMGNRHNVK